MARRTAKAGKLNHLVIRASAGTGKTFQLSLRYISLLHQGVPPELILASTFTRKAAGEILQRIVTRLAEAALDADRSRELGGFLSTPQLAPADCLSLLQSLLRRLHRLRISTLDSLFAQLGRSFSLEVGLPPGWRILDEAEDEALRNMAIDELVRQEKTDELLELTHLLTKGEATRGVHALVQSTVRSLHGLFQETTAPAWHALPRAKPLKPEQFAAALHDLQASPIDNKRLAKARDEDLERASCEDWEEFLTKGLAAKILSGECAYYKNPISVEICRLYEPLFQQARSELVNRVVRQTEGSFTLLQHFDEIRARLLREHGGLRFDDITRALDLATRPPEEASDSDSGDSDSAELVGATALARDPLSHRLDGQVEHLLLDEFQDTSPVQWRALRGLIQGVTGDRPDTSFFCVGDVKQAIYGWRGGVAEIFDDIEKQLPSLEQRQLNTSFRSSRAVIECVNRVFQGARRHPDLGRADEGVNAWCQGFTEHTTSKTEWAGYACLRTAPAPADGRSAEEAVLDAAAELVADLHHQAPRREIGVLVRTNATVAALIHRLRERELPASEEGGNPLTDSAAVQLILSLLRLSDHPGDTVAFYHLATSPLAELLGDELPDLAGRAGFSDVNKRVAQRWAILVRSSLQNRGYGPSIQHWSAFLRPSISARDATRLEQLVQRAFRYQSRASLRADDFIRAIELERVAEPSRAPIRVMTIHQSKGLEFDAVVLPELDENLLSQSPAFVVERREATAPVSCVCRYANAQIQQLLPARFQEMFDRTSRSSVVESMCLLYVALTRAIHGLYMVIQPNTAKVDRFKQTMAGIVRAGLAGDQPLLPATQLFECGDPGWWSAQGRATAESPTVTAPQRKPRRAIQLASSAGRVRALDRISPSGLEGGTHLRMRRQLEATADKAMLRGTILHACLAEVTWVEEAGRDEQKLRRAIADALQSHGQSLEPDMWLIEFSQLLARPWLQEQLKRTFYDRLELLGLAPQTVAAIRKKPVRLQVETERSFAVRDGDGIMSGSIDRLVLLYHGEQIVAADILDFKTDAVPEGDARVLQERVDYYQPQLSAYRRAVCRMTGLPPTSIAARLLFLSVGRAVSIP